MRRAAGLVPGTSRAGKGGALCDKGRLATKLMRLSWVAVTHKE